MSWNVYLNCKCCEQPLIVDLHTEGGTYVVGGTNKAELDITYNYSKLFAEAVGYSCRFHEWLDGKEAKDVTAELEIAVAKFGTERDKDSYWTATPGNAGYALSILLGWAKQHPYGVFVVH